MIKKAIDSIWKREIPLNERIFRMIVLVGMVLAVFGIVECAFLVDNRIILIPFVVLFFDFAFSAVMTFYFKRIDIAAISLVIILPLIVFPTMFLYSGGFGGGAIIWLVVGIFYIFLMFDGIKLKLFLCYDVIIIIGEYLFGYYHPEYIVPLASHKLELIDSFFSVIMVGLAVGIILKLQQKIFNQERAVALHQKDELEEISESKSNYFASMSHEIRTPINTVIGLNEVILRESEEPEIREYAENIQRASKMLLNLVNDILDLTQMEMKGMEILPSEYMTAELFYDLIDMTQVRLKEKNLDFKVDIDENLPSVLYGDEKRIEQVLLNILTNAVKYTKEGSVTLSADMERIADGEIILKVAVEDTGIGIRKEDLQDLYEAFRRVDVKQTRKIEGSGLGLSITKQLVDHMNGKITVDSIYTKGSTFTVSIPQQIVERAPMGDILAYAQKQQKNDNRYECLFEAPEARILVVDDNDMNATVVEKLLKNTKVQIDTVRDGETCLRMTQSRYYHVILMDYMMPDMDGGEVLKQLRHQENGLCRESIVIVLTAFALTEANRLYRNYGFDGYLEKPVQGRILEEQILRFLPDEIVEYRRKLTDELEIADIQDVIRKRKRKVMITTDCTSDIPAGLREKYYIDQVYSYIVLNNGRFADTLEIDSDDMTDYLNDMSRQIRVESMSVEEYEAFYAEELTKAEEIIHISLCSGLGKGYSVAKEAAKGFDHVHVVDSELISCGEGMLVCYAAKLAYDGKSVSEILEEIVRYRKNLAFWTFMPSMRRVSANGYLNGFFVKISNMLELHPILTLKNDRIVLVRSLMGKMSDAYRSFLKHCLRQTRNIDKEAVCITYAGISAREIEAIRSEILRLVPFEQVILQPMSVSLTSNGGIGTLGIAYHRKRERKYGDEW